MQLAIARMETHIFWTYTLLMQGSLSMPDSEVNQNSYTGLTVTLSFDLLSVDTQRHILSSLVVQRRNTAMNKATCSSIKWILTHSRPAQNMNRTLRSVNCEFRLRSDLEREREKEIERGEEERLAGWIFRDFMTTLWAVVSYFFLQLRIVHVMKVDTVRVMNNEFFFRLRWL